MTTPILSLDWGSTNFRAVFLMPGQEPQRAQEDWGLINIGNEGFEGAFYNVCGPWLEKAPQTQIYISGMAGAREGWLETAYLDTPLDLQRLFENIQDLETERGHIVHILPGACCKQPGWDLMRGEETQVLGAMEEAGISQGLFCLPGTHSKWVRCENAKIQEFSTFVTGELYAVLTQHAPLIISRSRQRTPSARAFEKGVDRSGIPGGLLRHLFSARSEFLCGQLEEAQRPDYLSGLIIGEEIRRATGLWGGEDLYIIGSGPLARRYQSAMAHLNRTVTILEGDFTLAAALAMRGRP